MSFLSSKARSHPCPATICSQGDYVLVVEIKEFFIGCLPFIGVYDLVQVFYPSDALKLKRGYRKARPNGGRAKMGT